jgi:hypothetical protein
MGWKQSLGWRRIVGWGRTHRKLAGGLRRRNWGLPHGVAYLSISIQCKDSRFVTWENPRG